MAIYLANFQGYSKKKENSISMFKELMLRRKKKLLSLVFARFQMPVFVKQDYENMLAFEKNIFETICQIIKQEDLKIFTFLDYECNKQEKEYKEEILELKNKLNKLINS
jgi:DNA replication initiation complex subunit (GINS family)